MPQRMDTDNEEQKVIEVPVGCVTLNIRSRTFCIFLFFSTSTPTIMAVSFRRLDRLHHFLLPIL